MDNDDLKQIIRVKKEIEELNLKYFFDKTKQGGGFGEERHFNSQQVFDINDKLVVMMSILNSLIRKNS